MLCFPIGSHSKHCRVSERGVDHFRFDRHVTDGDNYFAVLHKKCLKSVFERARAKAQNALGGD